MTVFKLKNLDKWMHQNRAKYTGDYFEGVLLDNFALYTTKKNGDIKGYAFVYESYVNPNASEYLVKYAKDIKEIGKLYSEFIDMEDMYYNGAF